MTPGQQGEPYIAVCPVGCSGPLIATATVLPEGALRRCLACGQLLSRCSESRYRESMREFDDPLGTLPDDRSASRRNRREERRLRTLCRLLRQPPAAIRLLDVGCSSGALLRVAQAMGFAGRGVEPAPRAARAARAAGLEVHCGLLEEAGFAAGSFDAITLLEVIEHLREPAVLLRECHRLLRPGGAMLVGTGNAASWTATAMGARWEYFHIDRHGGHVSFFNPDSLERLARRCGFRVARRTARNLRFFEKGQASPLVYHCAKIMAEMLAPLARGTGRGHDLELYLLKPG